MRYCNSTGIDFRLYSGRHELLSPKWHFKEGALANFFQYFHITSFRERDDIFYKNAPDVLYHIWTIAFLHSSNLSCFFFRCSGQWNVRDKWMWVVISLRMGDMKALSNKTEFLLLISYKKNIITDQGGKPKEQSWVQILIRWTIWINVLLFTYYSIGNISGLYSTKPDVGLSAKDYVELFQN